MERFNVAYPEMAIYFYIKQVYNDALLNYDIENIEPYESVDIYIPSLNLIIEYDGGLTHADRMSIDSEKSKLIIDQGYTLIRIRDNGLSSLNIDGLEEILYKRDSNKSIQYMLQRLLDLLVNSFKDHIEEMDSLRDVIDVDKDNMAILSVLPPVEESINAKQYYPKIGDIWDYKKNSKMKPEYFKPYSNHKAWFKCNQNHSYLAQIGSKVKGHGCPYCEGQLATDTNNLAVKFPEIAKEWNVKLNKKTPKMMQPHSNEIAYWDCAVCKSTYDKKINERTGNQEGCPYCAGKRVNSTNSLAVTHKTLSDEWDVEKNGDLTPDDVTRGSHKKVWWLCKKGHSYQASVYRRAGANGTGCPTCYELYGRQSPRKVKEKSSLAARAPGLAKQWDDTKNECSPYEIARYSKKEYWWKCEKGHEFKRSPNSRRGPKCSYCC